MKKLIFCFALLFALVSACKKVVVPSTEDIYSGQMKYNIGSRIDSFPVKLKFDFSKGQFSYLPNGCNGRFDINNNKITFTSQGCSCWCNCNPYVDCGGDFILDTFDFPLDRQHLILTRDYFIGSGNKVTFDLKKE